MKKRDDSEERQILMAYESGELRSVSASKAELAKYKEASRATFVKNRGKAKGAWTRRMKYMDGVRRSKAAQMAGHQSIRARLYGPDGGKIIREFEVTIESLRSPHKSSIRRITKGDALRWQRVVEGAQQSPLPFPPIEVVEGDRGVKIEDITFDFGASP